MSTVGARTAASGVPATLATAESAAEAKDWSRAADLLADAGEASDILDKRAFYLSRAKRYDEALEVVARLRQREPANFLWPYMTAYQYYAQERYEESLPWFREALKRNPNHLKSWWRAANALSKSGQETKAVVCAGRVLRLWNELPREAQERERSNLAKASYFLGKVQMRNDATGAVPLLEQAVANDMSDPHKHYRLGKALRLAGRPMDAIEHVRRAGKLKQGDGNIELELALCLGHAGKREEALQIIRRRSERMRGWDLWKSGHLAFDLDEPQLALRLLEQAARDKTTRNDEKVKGLLIKARDAVKGAGGVEVSEISSPPSSDDAARGRGRVDVVRADRNFGFLVDESNGIRRHFRLGELQVRVGEYVSYLPLESEKGPAATDLRST